LIKNIFANIFGKFWSFFSIFLFVPLYIKILGFESFSIVSFTLVIAALISVLDAGLTATLEREFARTDISLVNKFKKFRTLESLYLIILFVTIVLLCSFSDLISHKWLHLNSYSDGQISKIFKLVSLEVGFQMLFRFYLGGLFGLEKQVTANIFQISWGICRNGFVLIGILLIPTLEMFFIWQSIATVVFSILLKIILSRTLTGKYRFDWRFEVDKNILRDVWRFAGGMLLISFVAALNTQMDKLAISSLLSIENLGYYSLAVSLSMAIVTVVTPISVALLPRFTALYSGKKNDEALNLFNLVNSFTSIIIFSLTASMVFFAKNLIWIWTGNLLLAEQAGKFLPIIAISVSMLSLVTIPYAVAIANGYTLLNNVLGLLSLFLTLPGYWIGTKYFGAIGAASVYCFVQTSITLIYLYFINKKFLGLSLVDLYLKKLVVPLLLALSIAYSFSKISFENIHNRFLSLLWIGVVTFITFSVCVLFFVKISNFKEFKNQLLLKKF
jgi:O-antigen/teichoic acid export membrane protein